MSNPSELRKAPSWYVPPTERVNPPVSNKDEIYMLNGFDLDKKVAENLFGYTEVDIWKDNGDKFLSSLHREFGSEFLVGLVDFSRTIVPKYSTDWNAMQRVLQLIYDLGGSVRIEYAAMGSGHVEYSAAYVEYELDGEQEIYKVRADTLPVAVCQLALLKALHYPWDNFESHYMCRECGIHMHKSKGSDEYTQMSNLFKSYPHFRDKAVKEYLEEQKGKSHGKD